MSRVLKGLASSQKIVEEIDARGPVLNFVFLDLLSGGVELFVKANHKLTHRLFPVLDRHGPALADMA